MLSWNAKISIYLKYIYKVNTVVRIINIQKSVYYLVPSLWGHRRSSDTAQHLPRLVKHHKIEKLIYKGWLQHSQKQMYNRRREVSNLKMYAIWTFLALVNRNKYAFIHVRTCMLKDQHGMH